MRYGGSNAILSPGNRIFREIQKDGCYYKLRKGVLIDDRKDYCKPNDSWWKTNYSQYSDFC
jgi:hypothetical protein